MVIFQVKHYPSGGYGEDDDHDNHNGRVLQGEDGEEMVLAGEPNEKLLVDVSESSI